MDKSAYQRKVDVLSKATSTLTIRGKVFEEANDTVTLQVGNSLFEIPRESILSMTDIKGVEAKTIDLSIDREAKIIQKTLVTPDLVIGALTSDTVSLAYCPTFCPQYCIPKYCIPRYCFCPQYCFCIDPVVTVSDEQVIQKTFRAKQQKREE